MQNGKQRVLAYASRSLNHSEESATILYLSPRHSPRSFDRTCMDGSSTSSNATNAAYADNLRAQLAHAYDLASKAMYNRAEYNKKSCDQYGKESYPKAGDRVLVRNLSTRGKHKLQDRWEATRYIIIRKVWELPVYAVRPEGGGKEKVLHRNLLLPCRVPELETKRHEEKEENTKYTWDSHPGSGR